tara:strand:- start:919 stop:1086 length:168 start_codon:yes stop_codon:yes gene_type:complete
MWDMFQGRARVLLDQWMMDMQATEVKGFIGNKTSGTDVLAVRVEPLAGFGEQPIL